MGTPKTLEQAIKNGLLQAESQGFEKQGEIVEIIRAHIIDYLAQKFGAAMLQVEDSRLIEDLFKKIKFGKKA